MNPFLTAPHERLRLWRASRLSLSVIDEEEQLMTVAQYWAQAPMAARPCELDDVGTIPTPWEMIHEGHWCPASVALGMEFTLRLGGWDESRLAVKTINDKERSQIVTVCEVDGARWLNYEMARVVDVPSTPMIVMNTIVFRGRSYQQQ